MNQHLTHLIEIANIDKDIDSFEPRIAQIREDLNRVLNKKEELAREITRFGDEKRDIELKAQKNELHLEELSAKLDEIAKKGKAIKTEKEMKALNLEEEIAREQVGAANDEIARLEKLKENKIDEIANREEQIKTLEAEQKEIEKAVQSQIDEIEKSRKEVFKAKEKLVVKMDQKIIAFYEKIRKWAKNTSVVPVRKQACGGCFIKINDKIYSEVIKSEDIVTCPHCGRILYTEVQA
ncbi:MAG: zinc ribbon domain-containing protein [Wolinella sp.]